MHFNFYCAMADFKSHVSNTLNQEVSDDMFHKISLHDVNERILVAGPSTPSKVLNATLHDLSDPSTALMPVICTDGSLMIGNSTRAAAYATSFRKQLPAYNVSMVSSDTSSSTSVELQAINYAIQVSLGLGLKRLAVFSDSTSAISLASLAIMAGPHQNRDLNKLSNENELFKMMLNTLHENGKRFELLCLVHVKAHGAVVCHITETNSLCDVLAKQAAKAALLSRLPAHIVRPKMSEINIPIAPSVAANSLTY